MPIAHNHDVRQRPSAGDGYTLVEIIVVVTILAVLVAAVVLSVSGLRASAAETGCVADAHQLAVAAERYFAEEATLQIPATGSGADRYDRTLTESGYLPTPSVYHQLDTAGKVLPKEGSPC